MIIYIFLLVVVLSLEATIGLPIFFLYLSYRLISRRSDQYIFLSLFLMALLLAIFYSLSWPVIILLLLFFHILNQKLLGKPLFGLLLFIILNLFIFKLANLQLNCFYLVQLLFFLFYFYKINFKKYEV